MCHHRTTAFLYRSRGDPEGNGSNPTCIPAQLGVLKDRALATALAATRGSAEKVARCVRAPSDDQRYECHGLTVQASLADHPAPRRAAAQLLEGRRWHWFALHARNGRTICPAWIATTACAV